MKRNLTLLKFSLVACREAAAQGKRERASAELVMSKCYFAALRLPAAEAIEQMQKGLHAMLTTGTELSDTVLIERHDMYAQLSPKRHCDPCLNESLLLDNYRAAILIAIELGQSLITEALARGDTRRAEIEADHIHNLPVLFEKTHGPSRVYYMDTERDYYLERIERYYGIDERNKMAALFESFWSEIGKPPQKASNQ